jgi:hypothetical protein
MAPRLSSSDFAKRSQAQRIYPEDEETNPAEGLDLSRQSKAFKRKKKKARLLSNKERSFSSPLGGQAVQRSVLGAKR